MPRTPLEQDIRESAPCKCCSEKFTACHDRCPKDERGEFGYKAWKDILEDIKKKRRAYMDLKKRKKW